jgi:hypothetical protein
MEKTGDVAEDLSLSPLSGTGGPEDQIGTILHVEIVPRKQRASGVARRELANRFGGRVRKSPMESGQGDRWKISLPGAGRLGRVRCFRMTRAGSTVCHEEKANASEACPQAGRGGLYLPCVIIMPPKGPRPSQVAGRFQGMALTWSESDRCSVAQPPSPKAPPNTKENAKSRENERMVFY